MTLAISSVRRLTRSNAAAAVPPGFSRVLDRLASDVARHFGACRVSLDPVAFHERPFSQVLELRTTGDDGVSLPNVFAKIVKPKPAGVDLLRERMVRDFEANRRVHAGLQPFERLGAVPPVACYPEWFAIATEAVVGPTLLEYLQGCVAWFGPVRLSDAAETMATVGRWIRVFQSVSRIEGGIVITDIPSYVDVRLQRMVAHPGSGFSDDDRRRVLAHLERLLTHVSVDELAPVPTHADMALGNVVVCGKKVVVLDFEMAGAATRLHDLTRVFVQLDLLAAKPHVRGAAIARLQHSLVEGFDPALTLDAPLFRALTLLHRVNHLTTLTVRSARFPETIYNAVVRRYHRTQIAAELRRGELD